MSHTVVDNAVVDNAVAERQPLLPQNIDADVAPHDRWKLVYVILYLLGTGSLLPWNFFSNAEQYFQYKLRNTSLPESDWNKANSTTDLQNMFESYLAIAAMIPNVLFLFLNTAATKYITLDRRMISASLVMIAMFILTILLVYCSADEWQSGFFAVTLLTIIIMNAGSAVLQGGMFGLASMFPSDYIQAAMGGMGMGGTIAAVANVLAVTFASSPLSMGFGYFIIALGVLILAFVGYLCLPLLHYARYYRTLNDSKPNFSTQQTCEEEEGIRIEIVDPRPLASEQDLTLWQVFCKIKTLALLVFTTFTITLSCYPAVNSAIKSVQPDGAWAERYFVPVSCFLIFNVTDLIGRTIPSVFIWPKDGSPFLILLCISRAVFVPLFLLCNKTSTHYIPIWLYSDAAPIVLMILFGLSNGYLSTLCMMYGPRRVPSRDSETAGSMMSFFLALGLGVGSMISYPFVRLQTGS